MIKGCRPISFRGFISDELGNLNFFEKDTDVGFHFERIYYISAVDEGVTRGYHGHKKLKQVFFVPYGEIDILLDNGFEKEVVRLKNDGVGLVIEEPVWREMTWVKKDSVLVVGASEKYDESDYLREYDDFINFVNSKGDK